MLMYRKEKKLNDAKKNYTKKSEEKIKKPESTTKTNPSALGIINLLSSLYKTKNG